MKAHTRSILQELSDLSVNRNKHSVIESRGTNLIESAINLLNLIKESYSAEVANELERRFINSIKGRDSAKFTRGLKRIKENENAKNKNSSI